MHQIEGNPSSNLKKKKFLKTAIILMVVSSLWFVITNIYGKSPSIVIAYNASFFIIFSILLVTSFKRLKLKIIITGLIFQAFIFGHAFWILPGKQIESGLGLLVSIMPAFLRGFWMWVMFSINLVLYVVIQYHAPYYQLFYGIYLFYIVVFLIVKTVVDENASYETSLLKKSEKIEEDAEKLRDLVKIKDTFLANISHELRTPLTLISGPLQRLAKDNNLNAQSSRYLSIIKRNTDILSRRVTELIEFASTRNPASNHSQEWIHIVPFTEEIVKAFQAQLDVKEIRLRLHAEFDKKLAISSNKTKLEIIIFNLISNAVKFTGANGKIDLYIKREGEDFVLVVQDTGIGISHEQKSKIFDRFYKGNAGNTYDGYGLGLSLVHKLIQELNGRIALDSTLGEGSIFTFTAPCEWKAMTLPPPSQAAKIYNHGSKESNKSRKTILLLEDNHDLRFYMEQILKTTFDVLSFGDAKSALETVKLRFVSSESSIDLIITDLMMPQTDGYTFINELRRLESEANIPILVISALPSDRLEREMYSLGVSQYLQKPFVEEVFLDTISDILEIDNSTATVRFYTKFLKDDSMPKSGIDFLDQVESMIVDEIDNNAFNLSAISDSLNISDKAFQVKVKSYLGLTPKKYQQYIKLAYARNKINEDGITSIKDLASLVGYTDPAYFSKLFKKEFGVSPKEFLNT